MSCNSLGAALAYPETLDVLDFLVGLVKTAVGPLQANGISVLFGLNFRLDSTVQGIYAPNDDILSLAQGSGGSFRMLDINESLYFISENLTSIVPTQYAVCQLYGPEECWNTAPDAMANMTRTYNYSVTLNSTANYKCYPGYFYGGNVLYTGATKTCLGQLGDWGSSVANCVPLDGE
nr:uncharacterized protein LOC123754056 [Procambarus clarkii]